ncbi:proliferation marker protein Ki-67-like [Mytilus californianus]|uniref:proliferation marker protein Ki-67-like n=1 Tax=Mytilus californianus TaxID=6549 RepID=UPI0022474F9A|nr:proliferation marker protein Ki-67-like [Mytilus californianus]
MVMLYGEIIVIKRSGVDGAHFPLTVKNCLFGRGKDCDIIIKLPNVSGEHCRINVSDNKQVFLTNLSIDNPVLVNSSYFDKPIKLNHGDVFTIIDRSFRFDETEESKKSKLRNPDKDLNLNRPSIRIDDAPKSLKSKSKKKSKEEVKSRSKRRRMLKKQKYWEQREKEGENDNIDVVENDKNRQIAGTERKPSDDNFYVDMFKDPLFSKMVTYQKAKRLSLALKEKGQKNIDILE